jgi:hypothetical protein
MDIEHRKTFVTGKTFGHGVSFVRAQGSHLLIIHLSDQAAAGFANATKRFLDHKGAPSMNVSDLVSQSKAFSIGDFKI